MNLNELGMPYNNLSENGQISDIMLCDTLKPLLEQLNSVAHCASEAARSDLVDAEEASHVLSLIDAHLQGAIAIFDHWYRGKTSAPSITAPVDE